MAVIIDMTTLLTSIFHTVLKYFIYFFGETIKIKSLTCSKCSNCCCISNIYCILWQFEHYSPNKMCSVFGATRRRCRCVNTKLDAYGKFFKSNYKITCTQSLAHTPTPAPMLLLSLPSHRLNL